MTFTPRPYAEIAAQRRERIMAGEKTNVPKGACFYCAWPFHAKQREIFCSNDCRKEYLAEVAEHGPA